MEFVENPRKILAPTNILREAPDRVRGASVITARLEEGQSIKECKQCKADGKKYQTNSIDKMLTHLNEHRLEELIELKKHPSSLGRIMR